MGAGIVGISLAHALAERGADVTVLDRDPHEPKGSTAFAPGFVGLYNDVPILTELARDSAAVYDTAPRGFRRRCLRGRRLSVGITASAGSPG